MKHIIIGFLCLVVTMTNGQCLEGDCANGFGIYESESLVITKSGETSITKDTYSGFFKDSLFHGVGIIQQSDGGIFKGGFQDGLKHGASILTYTDKQYTTYAEYEDGEKNGYCFATTSGNLAEAAKYKKGKYQKDLSVDYNHKITGNRCLGNCVNGFGLKVYGEQSENNYYSGFFWQELQQFIGIRQFDSGSLYKGATKKSERQGFGEYVWPDGQVYVGEWHKNEMSGYGMIIEADGTEKFGIYKKGKFVKSLR